MATSDLREELNCSICLDLYKNPISLKCGHNFCRECIVTALDEQEGSGHYSCPECRKKYTKRPLLHKNRKLSNIVERFRSAHRKETEVLCTYCDSPVPAAKSCLHCEASFCEKHLSKHSESVHHILIEPTKSFEGRKCSTHKEILKYYCTEDGACICMSCWVAGDHRGHKVELLNQASEKLKDVTKNLNSERQKAEKRIQNLENHRTQEKGKAADVIGRVTELFRDIRKQLDDVEKRILTDTSRQEVQILLKVSDLIWQLKRQKNELSRKVTEVENLHKITDPITVQKKEMISDDIIPESSDNNSDDIIPGSSDNNSDLRDAGCLDEGIISQMLHRGLLHFVDSLIDLKNKSQFSVMEKSDISLDINTAHDKIIVSGDLKVAYHSDTCQNRPEVPERFKSQQVLSTNSFTSGKHYWEVDVSGAEKWLIGVAAHSIERKINGTESYVGYNEKSWGLQVLNECRAQHIKTFKKINTDSPLKSLGIYLDYDAGRLSFYQLSDTINHLHTFTATFTEPLHAAFYLFTNCSIKITK